MSKKIAVLFPGIGYTCDKPLLYYAGKIAKEKGYEIFPVPYSNFPTNIRGNQEKMEEVFYSALAQAEEILKDISWEDYADILFISKSVGTIVSCAYRKKYNLHTANILYTPLEATFQFTDEHAIVFHGNNDPWVETEKVIAGCEELDLPMYLTVGGNHSLETGDVLKDVRELDNIIRKTAQYIDKVVNPFDKEQIKKVYDDYAAHYDLSDPKIKLKYDHTYHVADLSERIASSLNLSKKDIDMAWTQGMFHDIGRFEQVRRYHTFFDKESVNHAALSADILYKEKLIEQFKLGASAENVLMEKVVRLHNVYILPDNLTEREKLFADILRDADKIDILRVNCETPREDIYGLPAEEFLTSSITDEVYQSVLEHRMIDRKYSKTGVDFILGHIAFVFGLNFPESRKIIKEQGFLDKLLDFKSENEETREKLEIVKKVVNTYLG